MAEEQAIRRCTQQRRARRELEHGEAEGLAAGVAHPHEHGEPGGDAQPPDDAGDRGLAEEQQRGPERGRGTCHDRRRPRDVSRGEPFHDGRVDGQPREDGEHRQDRAEQLEEPWLHLGPERPHPKERRGSRDRLGQDERHDARDPGHDPPVRIARSLAAPLRSTGSRVGSHVDGRLAHVRQRGGALRPRARTTIRGGGAGPRTRSRGRRGRPRAGRGHRDRRRRRGRNERRGHRRRRRPIARDARRGAPCASVAPLARRRRWWIFPSATERSTS